jgi:hypothetical protein
MKDKIEEEWLTFFDKVFDEVKKMVYKQNPVEEDGSGSPETLAIREAIESFPCQLRIAEIKIDVRKYSDISDEVCQIINYNLTRFGERSLEYYGVIDSRDKEKLKQTLIKYFNLNEKAFDDFYKDFKHIGWADDNLTFYTQFTVYNIKNNFERFVLDFYTYFIGLVGDKLSEKFKKVIDYNRLFNLKPDPILPLEEFIKRNDIEGFLHLSFHDLQERVCNFQLIPDVPEHVKRVFDNAKKLFIFGYLHYQFFTISQHYAYLALESGIRHRYNLSLGKKAKITNPKGESIEISPSWMYIHIFCKMNRGWNSKRIKVNGEDFPYNNRRLLNWLLEKKIVTRWERKQYDVGINMRNILSHLEFAPIHGPGSSAIKIIADRINRLFYEHKVESEKLG